MNRRSLAGCVFGLLLALGNLAGASLPYQPSHQQITPAPHGPFHIERNQIIDSQGQPFLIRGTQLTEFRLETVARDARQGEDYGPHSATSLSAIRLRFNMNAVRLPVNGHDVTDDAYFAELAKVVSVANNSDLLVILAVREPTPEFWGRCAAHFKSYPNVMFEAAKDAVQTIRSGGATQPILVLSDDRLADPQIIYAGTATVPETSEVPRLANWDLDLTNAAECSTIPSDPSAATRLVQEKLKYFDAHQISWECSAYEPGRLIKDFSLQDATSLENGWTCGVPSSPPAGLGRVVEAYLRADEERGLFVVSGGGGVDVARGGYAIAYGPVMAERDARGNEARLAFSLAGISVQVEDALGVTRPAGIFWASAGWGQVNFVVPAESAPGPARVTIVRKDGSTAGANMTIGDTAPGFWTNVSCRGPALGVAIQQFANGREATSQLSSCKGYVCSALPVPVKPGTKTRVRLVATGFRYAGSAQNIEVTIGGVRVPVVSFGPSLNLGVDQVTIEIPASLRGFGETDIVCHVNGRVANAVRIRIA